MNCLMKDQSLFQSAATLTSFYCPIINLTVRPYENNDISTVKQTIT